MKKRCALCGHFVGGGGDRHAAGSCPPIKRGKGSERARHRRALKRKAKQATSSPKRGVTVAGIKKKKHKGK